MLVHSFYRAQTASLQNHHIPGIGNFNSLIINHYLSHCPSNSKTSYYSRYTDHTDNLCPGQITEELLENVLDSAAFKSAVIITTTTLNAGHAIKIYSNDGRTGWKWFVLDSRNECPIPLNCAQDWNNLYGNMLTIQTDSVWNHVEAGSVFHLADNTAPKQMDCANVTDTRETNVYMF